MSIAESVLRELVELCDMARDSTNLAKMKRGPELLRRLTQTKEMLLRVVHDAARNEADVHVHAALDALREDIAATRELVEKIADTKVFNNARHGKAADLRVRDLISDGMGLATALAMVAVASGQREAFEAAVKKLKEAAPSAAAATSAQSAAPAESSSAAAEPVPPPAQPAPTEQRMRVDPEGEALSQLTTQCSEGNRFLLGTDGTPVDLGQAFANFLQAAQGGYGPAQLQVGTMCEHGLGTAVDHRAALSWYRAAAEQDLPEALLALGRVLSEGRCSVPRDVREAAQHLERAAELGSSEAMLFLGEQLLLDDEGSTVAAGLDWIDRASKAGNARAQCRLAEEHLSGARATKDPGSAFELLVLSAAQGHAPAITALGGMYERGEWVDENNERAGELYLKAVQAGHRAALLPFARILLRSGENEHAKQILEDLGDSNGEALLLLGDMYENGLADTVPKLEIAFLHYSKAAKLGFPPAITKVANFVFSGAGGVRQDEQEAVQLYSIAAELGDAQAQAELGTLYLEGTLLPQSFEMAVRWLTQAADQDNEMACHTLAELYHDGRGVPKDTAKASELFARAVALGHPLTLKQQQH